MKVSLLEIQQKVHSLSPKDYVEWCNDIHRVEGTDSHLIAVMSRNDDFPWDDYPEQFPILWNEYSWCKETKQVLIHFEGGAYIDVFYVLVYNTRTNAVFGVYKKEWDDYGPYEFFLPPSTAKYMKELFDAM